MSRSSDPAVPAGEAPQPRAADRIRATARELFYREGVRAVGVDTIVSHAGVTKPTLYRCFSSKDELAAAYMRDYDAEFWERFEAAGIDCPDDPRRHIVTYLAGLGERLPAQLSGGQLQRVAIARALVHKPRLILADEPTGNLDPSTAAQVMDLLQAQTRENGASLILVTHSEHAAARADRTLHLTAQGLAPGV